MDDLLARFAHWQSMAPPRHPPRTRLPLYVPPYSPSLTLHSPLPRIVIEAEVRYAVRNEYAQTAIDVIARRCRLSFLNAQAALDALPRVVELMAEELHWSPARAKAETAAGTEFLLSMGLAPGAVSRRAAQDAKGVVERVEDVLGIRHSGRARPEQMVYSRAQFAAGEVEALRGAFGARVPAERTEARLGTGEVYELVSGLAGFEGVRQKDFDYVLEEAGFKANKDVDFDEFVEVRGDSLHLRVLMVC